MIVHSWFRPVVFKYASIYGPRNAGKVCKQACVSEWESHCHIWLYMNICVPQDSLTRVPWHTCSSRDREVVFHVIPRSVIMQSRIELRIHVIAFPQPLAPQERSAFFVYFVFLFRYIFFKYISPPLVTWRCCCKTHLFKKINERRPALAWGIRPGRDGIRGIIRAVVKTLIWYRYSCSSYFVLTLFMINSAGMALHSTFYSILYPQADFLKSS